MAGHYRVVIRKCGLVAAAPAERRTISNGDVPAAAGSARAIRRMDNRHVVAVASIRAAIIVSAIPVGASAAEPESEAQPAMIAVSAVRAAPITVPARTVVTAMVPRARIVRTVMIVMAPAHVVPSVVVPRMPAAKSVNVAATIVVVGATEPAALYGSAEKVRAVSKPGIVSSNRMM